jgi:hypothetical protein
MFGQVGVGVGVGWGLGVEGAGGASQAFRLNSTPVPNPTPRQVIMLLLGGFAIAAALSKHFIAKQLAVAILSRVGRRPRDVLLANMLVATFASMWISNVAAPVLCFSLVQVGSCGDGAAGERAAQPASCRWCAAGAPCKAQATLYSATGSPPPATPPHPHPHPPSARSPSCARCRRATPLPRPWSLASLSRPTWVGGAALGGRGLLQAGFAVAGGRAGRPARARGCPLAAACLAPHPCSTPSKPTP